MENITDYVDGTAYIKIPKSAFCDISYFEDLLSFLCLPKDCKIIEICVNQEYIDERLFTIKQNYRGRC